MRFELKNLGPIKKADLELGDLTVIAGRNNTGKTLVAYAIFGFLNGINDQLYSDWGKDFLDGHFNRIGCGTIANVARKLLDDGRCDWPIDKEEFDNERDRLIAGMAKEYSGNGFFRNLRTSSTQFVNFSLRITDASPLFLNYSTYGPLGQEGVSISWQHKEGRVVTKLSSRNTEEFSHLSLLDYERPFVYSYLLFLLGGVFFFAQNPTIQSSSRHSIPLFIHDLDYVKSQAIFSTRLIQGDSPTNESVTLEMLRRLSNYPLAVNENIDSFRRILYRTDNSTDETTEVPTNPVEKLLGGRYRVTDNSLRFTSLSEDKATFDIPIHIASSSVRELAGLNYLLRELGPDSNGMIVIDEPESHLDTTNQIQFARMLAHMVQTGMKVLITTHSDYIVKELNNLIMLSNNFEDRPEVRERLGYTESLDPDMVSAYVAENGSLTKCDIDKYGIDMPHFDKTIDSINAVSNELTGRLSAEEEDV